MINGWKFWPLVQVRPVMPEGTATSGVAAAACANDSGCTRLRMSRLATLTVCQSTVCAAAFSHADVSS
eukprot:COSAG05_NODE_78_length_21399_cov_26.298216_19_plen_68_part_00